MRPVARPGAHLTDGTAFAKVTMWAVSIAQDWCGCRRFAVVAAARWMTEGPLGLLIADDDARLRSALREVFEPEGFRTYEASTGAEAVDVAQNEPVDLLMMDWQMPGMTGLEAFRLIKEMLGLLPCILMTGAPSKELLLNALAEQAYTVLEKPISPGVAVYTVHRVVKVFYHRGS